MCSSPSSPSAPPPPPQPVTPKAQTVQAKEAREQQRKKTQQATGQRGTILTGGPQAGGLGETAAAATGKKTLLGA